MRSPRSHRSRWSISRNSPGAGSPMALLVQSQFLSDPVHGPHEPFAQGFRAGALGGGDFGPVAALCPLLGQAPLLGREALADLLQQLPDRVLLAGGFLRRGQLVVAPGGGLDAAVIPPCRPLPALPVG